MKTTIEIADALLIEARKVATLEHTTVRSLVEQGLRQVIAQRKTEQPFRLRKASFKGRGLRPALRAATWATLRELAYEEHGA